MRVQKLSSNRSFIYHLLRRTARFHVPIVVSARIDITETLARIERDRERGRSVGLVALFIKATAMTLAEHPRFNERLFHTWWGSPRRAQFDEISCNTVVAREGDSGEELLIPVVLRQADGMSVEEIHDRLRQAKQQPLAEMPASTQLAKVSTLPRWLIRLLHFRFRSSPRFLIEKVGTYGVSSLLHRDSGTVSTFSPSPQTSFFPTNIEDQVVVIDGEPTVRTMLLCSVTADHYLVDGLDVQRMGLALKAKVENPELVLGPEQGP